LHLPALDVNTAAGKAARSLSDKIAKDMADLHPTKHKNGLLDNLLGINATPYTKDQMAKAGDAAKRLGEHVVQQFVQGQDSVKYHSTPAYLRQAEAVMKNLPPSARQHAAEQMVEYARGLEHNKRIPKGATDALINDIIQKYAILAPALKASGHGSMHELSLTFKDRRVVDSVQRQVDRIGVIWEDAPKLAKTNAGNARHNWQVEMDFLRHKIKTSTGQQRDDAVHAWRDLQKQGEGTSVATRHAMKLMAEKMKDDTKFGATEMGRAAKSGFDYLAGQVGRGVGATDKGMQLVRTSLSNELKLFGAGSLSAKGLTTDLGPGSNASNGLDAKGFAQGFGKALGGWVGNPGERGQDRELALLGRGEFVASGDQQPELQAALALAKALGLGSSGSLEELAQNRKVPHAQAFETGGRVLGGEGSSGTRPAARSAAASLPARTP